MQYRPQSDLVVRYRCDIRRDGTMKRDTVLAGTTIAGPHPGTLAVEAETASGGTLSVGVWRWPFDPILPDLAAMVTPGLVDDRLASLVGPNPQLEVVAYRPTERAVVRVDGPAGRLYVKVVPPPTTTSLVERHERLRAAGLPVPRVLAVGDGWMAMSAIEGTTLRDRLKQGVRRLPPAERYTALLDALRSVDLSAMPPVRSRIEDAPHHAAMLGVVLPDARHRLSEIVEGLAAWAAARVPTESVHGDLHEAQLVVDDDSVIGLLDIDDAGPGDPLDDIATLLGHLRFRAVTNDDARIATYVNGVRDAVVAPDAGPSVDARVAAVLIGLATGPFRIQQPDWEATTTRVLDIAERHLAAAEAPCRPVER